jgi:hypothetical protein
MKHMFHAQEVSPSCLTVFRKNEREHFLSPYAMGTFLNLFSGAKLKERQNYFYVSEADGNVALWLM